MGKRVIQVSCCRACPYFDNLKKEPYCRRMGTTLPKDLVQPFTYNFIHEDCPLPKDNTIR